MGKIIFALLTLILTFSSYSTTIRSFTNPKAEEVLIQIPCTKIQMTLADYVKLKPSGYKNLTGKKLNLKETIVFKITQKKIKKTIRKDGTIDMDAYHKAAEEPFKWNWGGFFLGLLLPIVGLIITAFFKDDQRKNRIDSAAIGTLIACIAFLIFVLSSF
jgi:hypothetical protein